MHPAARSSWILIPAAVAVGAVIAASSRQAAPRFDLVIRHGTVIDGSGAPAVKADVAIADGRIAVVSPRADGDAREVIDARGLVVAPGFIDVHTHADDLADRPLAENFVRMGVTSIVAGNCGASAAEVGEALRRIAATGASVNFATLVGHNTIRREVMGTERRAPMPGELDRMKRLVARAMADGAVGLSTGLQYVPGTYAETAEIVELAKVASAAGGLYASHMRNEGTEIEKAIAETIAIGEAAGCPVQISHLKIDSPNRWGASRQALALIDAARARGVDVRADQYVYSAASSTLGIRFPAWVLEGGQARIDERLDDPETWSRIKGEMKALLAARGLRDLSFAVVASYPADPSINGLSIKEVAARWKEDDAAEAQLETARDMLRAGGASMVYHFMSEEDIARIMQHGQVAFASDSSVLAAGDGQPHPRGYGNNARALGRYVRERRILPLEEAIRKMTSLPATHFRLADRGLIGTGYAADLVLLDPAAVADPATYERPHQYAAGMPVVVVNGVPVVREGRHTGARPGRVLRLPSKGTVDRSDRARAEATGDRPYLSAARAAATWLQAAAIAGERGTGWPIDPRDPKGIDTSLYSGTPGVVLFLLEAHGATGDRPSLDLARRGADYLLSSIASEKESGLYTGLAGLGFTLQEAYKATRDERYRNGARRVAELLRERATPTGRGVQWNGSTDVISGSTGIGLFLLYAARELEMPALRELAERAADRLAEIGRPEHGGMKWAMDETFPRLMPNFSHGTAGVAYFLATLHRETKRPADLSGALAGARYLQAVANTEGEACLVFHNEPDGRSLYYLSWCHGPAGTARLFYRLWQITGDESWMAWVKKSARAILASGIPERETPGFWNNVGQCCGSAGVAEFFLSLHAATGDEEYLRFAKRVADDILRRATSDSGGMRWIQAEHRVRPELLVAQTGYMQGAAGIGAWLLHLDGFEHGRRERITLPDSPFVP